LILAPHIKKNDKEQGIGRGGEPEVKTLKWENKIKMDQQ
jgi:hypothetical protein